MFLIFWLQLATDGIWKGKHFFQIFLRRQSSYIKKKKKISSEKLIFESRVEIYSVLTFSNPNLNKKLVTT